MKTLTINTHQFPITETLNFNGSYNLPYIEGITTSRQLTMLNCEINPNNKRVMFGSLSEEDLKNVVTDEWYDEETKAERLQHNRFAFYRHQIVN